jgi:tetratricopeptide (TPR) repeat protein
MDAQRRPRALFFLLVPVLAPLVFLLLLEGALRIAGIGAPELSTDPARGFLPFDSVFREVIDEEGAVQLEVRTPPTELPFMTLRQFNPQSHPARKPSGEYRILFVGDSLAYGWPYDDRTSFPRLLAAGLSAARPEVAWRVINMGAPGWGTTRLRGLSEELTRLDPDLVVVVTGNNEALEASFAAEVLEGREARVLLLSRLSRHSHLITLMMGAAERLRGASPAPTARSARERPGESRAVLVERFEENLTAIASTFLGRGSRVYLATVPVNLRDCPPLGRDGPGEASGSRDPALGARYLRARALLEQGSPAEALALVEPLADALPESARIHYLKARALDANGRSEDASEAYRRALNLDPSMLRAFDALNAKVESVAAETGASVLDLVGAIRAASEGGVPGDDLFLDNCHPNRRGTVVLALATAKRMARDSILGAERDWSGDFLRAIDDYLGAVHLSDQSQVEALKFLLFYSTRLNPDEERAATLQREIEARDPEGRHAGPAFRERFFRGRSSSPRQEAPR